MSAEREVRGECPKCEHPNHKYYTRVEGTIKLGHCFHCGYSSKQRAKRAPSTVSEGKREWNLPAGFSTDWEDWSAEAIDWVHQYGITPAECDRYKIGYAGGKVWLTIWDEQGLASMQGRSLDGTLPKYYTRKNRQAAFMSQHVNTTVILTEDVLSAVKAGRYTTTMALCGTSMNDVHLTKLLTIQPKRVLICLDNDNKEVRANQRKIKKTLDKYFECSIVRLDKDVKELTDKEIQLTIGVQDCE